MPIRKITVSFLMILILTGAFISSYMIAPDFTYAETDVSNWYDVTTNEQYAEAFRYYCKSRDLTIEGSLADAVTTGTTRIFNDVCNGAGIDMTALQGHLKYETDNLGNTSFFLDATGISLYNRLFAQFLQDNDLTVGDSANSNDNKLYEGEFYKDLNNNECLVYVIKTGSNYTNQPASNIINGTYYTYSRDEVIRLVNSSNTNPQYVEFTFDMVYTGFKSKIYKSSYGDPSINVRYGTSSDYNTTSASIYRKYQDQVTHEGEYCVYTFANSNTYYPAIVTHYIDTNTYSFVNLYRAAYTSNYTASPTTIYLTTNNTVINNNNYEGDTIINNEGDVINEGDTNIYNPYPDGGGTTTGPSNTGGGDGSDDSEITFPDFDFNFPEIDWSIGDLSEKFPFSIPFDLIAFFTVMNATPEAPAIDAEIPLGSWYTWHFEADFSQFDNWAAIIRNVEFIAFCIGLIYLTIKLVKG